MPDGTLIGDGGSQTIRQHPYCFTSFPFSMSFESLNAIHHKNPKALSSPRLGWFFLIPWIALIEVYLIIYTHKTVRRSSLVLTENIYKAMASSMISTAAVATRASPAQATMVAPFTGLRSSSAFPATTKKSADLTSIATNGGRVQCMKVWPTENMKKFETLSYLPPLTIEQLSKEIDYLLRSGWIPCLEFELKHGFVYREHGNTPGYYDGRYWTMWKLPMFGCTDASQVINELEECKKEYPEAFIRIIGFDNKRQVQCISFIAYKPASY